ncbi:hypothetical protein AB833_12290 [Chromatiales bacterium (ex Bugula neritina AB1)]|nr:hypothetical protein AB833_12290 [Chromatiales bacterium (ex Bugula neritina AB1)]
MISNINSFVMQRSMLVPLVLAAGLLSACGGSSNNSTATDPTEPVVQNTLGSISVTEIAAGNAPVAVVATRAFDFSAGAVSLVTTTSPFSGVTGVNASGSDIRVRSFGDNYYVLEGFGTSTLTRYSVSSPDQVALQVSTNTANSDEDSNPHDLVFVNDEKAYLLRYGSGEIWVVNPTATDEAGFFLNTIDLSGYDADGVPEMHRGAIVDGRLYVLMQRLDQFAPSQSAYVAVIDTATDTEVNTGTGGQFLGIELPVRNPVELSVDPATSDIAIAAVGRFAFEGANEAEFTGGVVVVDTNDFSTNLLIDDNETLGQFTNVAVLSATSAYVVNFSSNSDNSLLSMNPNNGELGETVAGLSDVDIDGMAIGPNGNLWVGVSDQVNPRLVVIDPASNTALAELPLVNNPQNIVFVGN